APVEKACGEGLMPAARASLERLGVTVEGRPFRGIRYLAPGHEATALFRRGDGVGVRRLALSTALVGRADALGVKRIDTPAGAPARGRGGVSGGGAGAPAGAAGAGGRGGRTSTGGRGGGPPAAIAC